MVTALELVALYCAVTLALYEQSGIRSPIMAIRILVRISWVACIFIYFYLLVHDLGWVKGLVSGFAVLIIMNFSARYFIKQFGIVKVALISTLLAPLTLIAFALYYFFYIFSA